MKIAVSVRCRGAVLCVTVFVTAVFTAALVGGITTAQPDPQGDAAPNAAPEQQKRGTLTVKVMLVDPAKQDDHQPAANALVHIQGTEDTHETNEQGQVTLSGISMDKVTLQIKVIGADMCLLRDIPVTGGDQIVSVLVEKSQNGKCRRL